MRGVVKISFNVHAQKCDVSVTTMLLSNNPQPQATDTTQKYTTQEV